MVLLLGEVGGGGRTMISFHYTLMRYQQTLTSRRSPMILLIAVFLLFMIDKVLDLLGKEGVCAHQKKPTCYFSTDRFLIDLTAESD